VKKFWGKKFRFWVKNIVLKEIYIDGTAEFVFLVEWDSSATASF